MKIIKPKKEDKNLTKDDTKVGGVYTITDTGVAYFRCQGGFVNLESGGFTQYPDIREGYCWIYHADAELHLNN
jgi:hypothetical protein